MYDLIRSWQSNILLRSTSPVTAFLECHSSSSKAASAVLHNHPQKCCYLEAERQWIMVRNRALPPWECSSRGSKILKLLTAFSQRFKHQQIGPWWHVKDKSELNPLFTCSAATVSFSVCNLKFIPFLALLLCILRNQHKEAWGDRRLRDQSWKINLLNGTY